MAGSDARDDATREAAAKAVDYTKHLDANALKGARLGVVRSQFAGRNDLVAAEVEKALEVLKAQGAILVELAELPNMGKYTQSELDVLLYELKADLGAYLAEYAPGSPVKTLADVIAFNEKHKAKEMPYFGQEHFVKAETKGGLDSKEYLDALANNLKLARAEGIDKALAENNLDALVAPTGQPAWLTDFIKGDASGGSFTSPAAVAGYPHITVPAGFVRGLPCGISFVGTAWSEARLIALAYAFEQASHHRKAPAFPKTVNAW
jgi:amidase